MVSYHECAHCDRSITKPLGAIGPFLCWSCEGKGITISGFGKITFPRAMIVAAVAAERAAGVRCPWCNTLDHCTCAIEAHGYPVTVRP